MNLEKMKKRRRVIETNPAWRKMINIQTEEDHFFNMENRWKKVNAACFSVSPSQQNMIVVKLVASWSKVFRRESHPEQGAPGWPAVGSVTSSLCCRRVSGSERPGQPLINTGLLTAGSREAGHICKHTESVNCSCPQHIMLFPPHCWDNWLTKCPYLYQEMKELYQLFSPYIASQCWRIGLHHINWYEADTSDFYFVYIVNM